MKKLSEKELLSINGGASHYHWICKVNGFVSTSYSTAVGASNALDNHLNKYPSHAKNSSMISCHKKH